MSDFDVLGIRRKACAAYFCKVPGFAGIRAWVCEIWSPRTEATGVFLVRWGTFFRSGFRLDPVKSWRSESSTSCMECVFFPTCTGLADQLVASQEDSARKRGNVGGKIPEISAQTLFRRPVFMRVVDVAPDVGFRRSWYRRKACATYFSTVQALHRGELGFARYDLANRGRRNVPYAKGVESKLSSRSSEWSRSDQFDSAFGLVQRSGQTLVKLGQPWSNLVEFGQSSPNSGKCIPDRVSRVFGHSGPQSGQKRSGQTLVKLGQPWSNLVKLREMCPGSSSWGHLMWRAFVGSGRLGSGCLVLRAYTRENPVGTAKNLPQFTCHSLSDTLALNRLTHGSKVKVGFRFLVFSLNSTFPTSAFSFPSSSDLALRKFVRLSEVSRHVRAFVRHIF
uniref:Uncharacterized protein n=1 Tax=Fagus sylvatica TaxID=28930 RepID=A0A2N9FRA9_FAGSY